jgi:hypothetical protein
MVAVQTAPTSYPTLSPSKESTITELALRLSRGWILIEERRKHGESVETYELHWLQLLAKYEAEIDS